MIKVALFSAWYPVTMSQYFRRALERRDDIELITVGPFTGNWIPWKGGLELPPKYTYTPTHPLPKSMISQRAVNPQIFQMFPDLADVDLWLEVDAGIYLDPKPTGGIVAHVATDPHCLVYDRQRQLADFFFNMQGPYIQEGDFYLPYAYDPTIHYPMPEVEKEWDACMIGLDYIHRGRLIRSLRAKGMSVYYNIGDIYDEYRLIYNQSRVALSWSSLKDTPTRVFEAFAMGVPLVANRTQDLSNWFVDGEHYLGFDDETEATIQVEKLLRAPDFADEIAQNALRKVRSGHKWDYRINQILEQCRLI